MVVLGDGDFLPLGDALKELGKMGFRMKRSNRGPGATRLAGGSWHI
jgi:hypothetical protein